MKEKAIRIIKKSIRVAAEASSQTTSVFMFYQPKTPSALKKKKNEG